MLRLTWGLVLGLFLLVAGASVLMKEAFGVNVPVFRVSLALVLLYAGVSLLAGTAGYRTPRPWDDTVVFGSAQLDPGTRDELSVVFGRGTLDLATVTPPRKLVLNVIFADAVLRYDPAVPLRITSTTAFGGTELPDGARMPFGERVWATPGWRADAPGIELTANVVFGHLDVRSSVGESLTVAPLP